MGKSLSEAPIATITAQDLVSGGMPALLARHSQELGPLFRWTIPDGSWAGHELVYLIGPEANKLVLNTQRQSFSHDQGWTPIVGKALGRGLLNVDDPEHARYRKMWNPAFASTNMEAYLPQMWQIIADRASQWAERGEIDLSQEVREMTFEIAATALAGIDRGSELEHLQKLFYTMISESRTLSDRYEESLLRVLSTRDELDTILRTLIAKRRATLPEEQPPDILDRIIRARDGDGEGLTDEEALGQLKILLVAGHETTTTLATYVLFLLATMGEQRRRVEAEIDSLSAGIDRDSPITVETLRDMKVLDNFIRETGRLHPPVHGVPRGVVHPVEFAGYALPVGTRIYLSLAGCHRLPGVFGNPDEFDPDRFFPPREEDKRTPYALVTFGGGPRLCIGVHFASIEVKLLAIHLLRHFRVEAVTERLPMQVGISVASIPTNVMVRIEAREADLGQTKPGVWMP